MSCCGADPRALAVACAKGGDGASVFDFLHFTITSSLSSSVDAFLLPLKSLPVKLASGGGDAAVPAPESKDALLALHVPPSAAVDAAVAASRLAQQYATHAARLSEAAGTSRVPLNFDPRAPAAFNPATVRLFGTGCMSPAAHHPLLVSFALMDSFARCIREGEFMAPGVFVPRTVWTQSGTRIAGYALKRTAWENLVMALSKLAQVLKPSASVSVADMAREWNLLALTLQREADLLRPLFLLLNQQRHPADARSSVTAAPLVSAPAAAAAGSSLATPACAAEVEATPVAPAVMAPEPGMEAKAASASEATAAATANHSFAQGVDADTAELESILGPLALAPAGTGDVDEVGDDDATLASTAGASDAGVPTTALADTDEFSTVPVELPVADASAPCTAAPTATSSAVSKTKRFGSMLSRAGRLVASTAASATQSLAAAAASSLSVPPAQGDRVSASNETVDASVVAAATGKGRAGTNVAAAAQAAAASSSAFLKRAFVGIQKQVSKTAASAAQALNLTPASATALSAAELGEYAQLLLAVCDASVPIRQWLEAAMFGTVLSTHFDTDAAAVPNHALVEWQTRCAAALSDPYVQLHATRSIYGLLAVFVNVALHDVHAAHQRYLHTQSELLLTRDFG